MKKFNNKLFRQTLSKFATGVTVVAINSNKKIIGKTVNSYSALSLKPPLVLFCLDKKTSDLKEFIKNNYLSINILSNKQSEISKNFAKKDAVKPKLINTKEKPKLKKIVFINIKLFFFSIILSNDVPDI